MSKQLIFSFLGSGMVVDTNTMQPGSVIKFGSRFEGVNLSFGGIHVSPNSIEATASRPPILKITATPLVVSPKLGAPQKKLKGIMINESYKPLFPNSQFEIGSTSNIIPLSKSQRKNKNRKLNLKLKKEGLKVTEALKVRDIPINTKNSQNGGLDVPPTPHLLSGSRFHPLSAAHGEESVKKIACLPPRKISLESEKVLRTRALQSFHAKRQYLRNMVSKYGMTKEDTFEHMKLKSTEQLKADITGRTIPVMAPVKKGRIPPVMTGANRVALGVRKFVPSRQYTTTTPFKKTSETRKRVKNTWAARDEKTTNVWVLPKRCSPTSTYAKGYTPGQNYQVRKSVFERLSLEDPALSNKGREDEVPLPGHYASFPIVGNVGRPKHITYPPISQRGNKKRKRRNGKKKNGTLEQGPPVDMHCKKPPADPLFVVQHDEEMVDHPPLLQQLTTGASIVQPGSLFPLINEENFTIDHGEGISETFTNVDPISMPVAHVDDIITCINKEENEYDTDLDDLSPTPLFGDLSDLGDSELDDFSIDLDGNASPDPLAEIRAELAKDTKVAHVFVVGTRATTHSDQAGGSQPLETSAGSQAASPDREDSPDLLAGIRAELAKKDEYISAVERRLDDALANMTTLQAEPIVTLNVQAEPPTLVHIDPKPTSSPGIRQLVEAQVKEAIARAQAPTSTPRGRPYPEEFDDIPYPKGYSPPAFRVFNGQGNLKQHLAHF